MAGRMRKWLYVTFITGQSKRSKSNIMDNHHVSLTSSSASCGVLEAHGITSDSEKVLYAIASRLYHPSRGQPAAFLLWSDISSKESNGGMLFMAIEKIFGRRDGGVGSGLQSSEVCENPLTGNNIQ